MYSDIIKSIAFFQNKPAYFLHEVLPKLKLTKFVEGEYIFKEDDEVDESIFYKR